MVDSEEELAALKDSGCKGLLAEFIDPPRYVLCDYRKKGKERNRGKESETIR